MKIAAKKQTAAGKASAMAMGGLGLEEMGDLSALLAGPEAQAAGGGPLALEIALIDEDPHQPRTKDNPGFSEQSLEELAASIRLRGVKTPISVRENPEAPGRYLINHGARRFRGAQRAGLDSIPGFIDNDYNEADQVVENLQRNELTAREIADFIGRELAKGVKKGDIAKAISKSPAFISQHVTLLDLPEPLAQVFNSGRVRDVTVVNELMTAYKKTPQDVSAWLGDASQEITRGTVKLLREFLDAKDAPAPMAGAAPAPGPNGHAAPPAAASAAAASAAAASAAAASAAAASAAAALAAKGGKIAAAEKLRKAVVHVRHEDRIARLMLERRPPAEGVAWLQYIDDGRELQASLQHVTLVALLEG
ncbi:transcriptional repressor gene korB [Comamonas endophytica]|uniref:ParB/RepB/Spo0J family partition protein n=1 Tax=Comamonas endophytica TaxID=2949090 RepID=A0ABY6GF08_9BURK|nr:MULTISPECIES: ParB/RepB/Spo0J family partition protein [unclassified Acidovorax]MCD2514385.1 ParB/RepB/Spo0J family partition protein [Acidovorax sp. D4N7]UYG53675.1 ParB/RepB/Spo0J family partition protein [Acidovorax sp. 5MLIR]